MIELPLELSHYEVHLPQQRHASRIDALLDLADGDRPAQDIIHLVTHARSLAVELADEARAAACELRLAQLLDGQPALEYARSAQARFEHLNNTPMEARSVLRQAELHADQPVQALAASLIAVTLAEEAQTNELKAKALRQTGELYTKFREDTHAIGAYEQVLAMAGGEWRRAEDIPLLLALGALHVHAKHLDEAFRAYRAAGHLTHLEGTIEHADSLGGLGTTYGLQGDHARAIKFLDKAAELSAQREDHRRHTRYLNLMASAHEQLGEHTQAAEVFKRSLAAAAASGKPDLYVITLLNMAEYALNQARYDEAAKLLDQALALSQQAQLGSAERRAQRMLHALAKARGDDGRALEHLQAWSALEQTAQARKFQRQQQVREATWQAELHLALRRERRHVRASLDEASSIIAELHQQAATWKDTSMFDSQSGARSRRYGIEQLTVNFNRSMRAKSHLSVAVVGVEMATVEQGVAGQLHVESVLRTIAEVLEHSVRDTDMVSRLDTWKFLVMFPETSTAGAKVPLLRTIAAVQGHDWSAQGMRSPPTLSIGLAGRGFLQGAQLLIDAADEAHYRAKREGQNQLSVAE